MNKNVTATILIVLAIGTYFTVTKAKLAEVNAVRAINEQYISAISNADQLVKVRDKVLKDYNAIDETDRERLDKIVPNTVDNIRLVIDLNSVGLRHGFSLRNIKAAAGTSGSSGSSASQRPSTVTATRDGGISTPTLDTVSISFSVSAPYQQFIEFMRDLEANLRIMDLTHLTVAANSTGTYDFGVELKTYYLRQQ
jgi:Tfp pilus assembly protein PilO